MSDSTSQTPGHARDAEAPTPSPSARADGFTVDLSSGDKKRQPEAWRRKRKTASPVLTKIVDLSTPADTAPKPAAPKASKQAPKPSEKATMPRNEKRRNPKPPQGNALADLLDPETLARLRGTD